MRTLQRKIGNAMPCRPSPFFSAQRAGAATFFTAPIIQTKLTLGAPGDRFEKDADAMADRVVQRMPAGALRQTAAPSVQAKCAHCREEERLQRKADEHAPGERAGSVPDAVQRRLENGRGAGHALEPLLRNDLETAFQADFSGVRINTGPTAEGLNRELHARAFTSGRDIYFNAGEFRPDTRDGRHLLAHELTHVVQQRHAPQPGIVSRTPAAYEDCSEATTGEKNWKPILDHALKRADDFVDAALCALARDPATEPATSAYPLALQRHFLGSSFALRKALLANFLKIRDELKPEKIRCVKTDDDPTCLSEKGLAGAFATGGQDWLCRTFWSYINRNCMAECLIHEAAHLIGLGLATPHPPYRGRTGDYPFGATPPPAGQTTAKRMDNPDAYGYFAMHVWREIDSECGVLDQLIQVTGKAPAATPPTSSGDKK